MTTDEQNIILYMHVIATLMMCIGYFMSDIYIKKLEEFITAEIKGVQERQTDKSDFILSALWNGRRFFLAGLLCIPVGLMLAGNLDKLDIVEFWWIWIPYMLIVLFLVLYGSRIFFVVAWEAVGPLVLSLLALTLSWFVLNSPKGPVAAIGMLILITSFILRWVFINH